eukprot:TRINITY_DN14548_c0_g1_i1.p1 TRINITY_DN14548_c0_g1~~TRINITY_DN14548_c0_g1_i1.p1  ORF type:complete len:271 (-),score=80.80 TRINITY_DN14548_c0_g1_i1:9-821(-)
MGDLSQWKKQTFYEVLGVDRDCSAAEIKKAYHKLALKHHPDRKGNTEEANATFQYLVRVYETLIHEEKRKYYDETGSDGFQEAVDFETLYEFYRSLFRKITVEDIDSFKGQYIDSGMEDDDIAEAYTKYKGKMKKILESVPYAVDEDYSRIQSRITEMIHEGRLKKFAKFQLYVGPPIPKPQKSEKASSAASAGKSSGTMTRAAEKMDALADQLMAKYAKPKGKGKGQQKGKSETQAKGVEIAPDIPDDEFEAIQKRLDANRRKRARTED